MKKKVALGLSGGVDSAVSAALLLEQGCEVTGVFMVCYQGPGCRSDEDRKDALDVALQLGIPFEVLDFREAYQVKVLTYFKREYEAGRTPNPDIMCNREIKFGLFYKWAKDRGFDYVATGHYARIGSEKYEEDRATSNYKHRTLHTLMRGVDERKDQSYFLYQLKGEQLRHILFPIGGMKKSRVREEARKRQLTVAHKSDSQGICFVGDVSARTFLKRMGLEEKTGEVVDVAGQVIGTHQGVWFYTIGQRHGFEVTVKNNQTPPLFILGKDMEKNQLKVGTREQALRREFEMGEMHWINELPLMKDEWRVKVRIRHLGELIGASCEGRGAKFGVKLDEPVFGVAPGQACVWYDGDVCLGGGIIE